MIRPATINDLPSILEILNEAILNSTAVYEYEPWGLEQITEWFETRTSEGFPIIVYEEDGILKGYATFGSFRKRVAYRFTVEHSIYVHKNWRGNSIGNSLMTELLTLAKSHKAHSVIGVVDATNAQSIAFHKHHGFIEAGTLREVGFKFNQWLDVALLQRMI